MARNDIERVYFYGSFPLLHKELKNKCNKLRVMPYLISGVSYDWGESEFEANTFISSNIRDTLLPYRQNNVSLWLGGHLVLFNKKNEKILELQIHLKKGIGLLYSIWRYDFFTKEVVQIISVLGSNLTITLAFPFKMLIFTPKK